MQTVLLLVRVGQRRHMCRFLVQRTARALAGDFAGTCRAGWGAKRRPCRRVSGRRAFGRAIFVIFRAPGVPGREAPLQVAGFAAIASARAPQRWFQSARRCSGEVPHRWPAPSRGQVDPAGPRRARKSLSSRPKYNRPAKRRFTAIYVIALCPTAPGYSPCASARYVILGDWVVFNRQSSLLHLTERDRDRCRALAGPSGDNCHHRSTCTAGGLPSATAPRVVRARTLAEPAQLPQRASAAD
jgi:hypothetical protein